MLIIEIVPDEDVESDPLCVDMRSVKSPPSSPLIVKGSLKLSSELASDRLLRNGITAVGEPPDE